MSTTKPPRWSFGSNSEAPHRKPVNAAAMAQLHTQYAVYREAGMGRHIAPWTREAALLLGRLFMVAHGRIPPCSYLRPDYSMPDESSLRRVFGTLQGYRDALSQEEETHAS